MNTIQPLLQAAYMIGVWSVSAKQAHSCNSMQWPPDPECEGCCARLETFIQRNHLELPHLLFGREAMVDHMELDILRRIEAAQAHRFTGAYI